MRVLYVSEVQWLSQVSRKHLVVRRFPTDWDVVFLSPANAAAGENSFRMRRDERYEHVRFASLLLPKPDSGIPLVRALTRPLSARARHVLAGFARTFRPSVLVCSYIWAAPAIPAFRGLGVPVVYDLNDLHTEFYPGYRDRAEELFSALVASADEVVSSSLYLRETAGRGIVIGNGVDLDTFSGKTGGPLPAAVSGSPLADCESLVAYVGSVDERVDFDLLDATLSRLRELPGGCGLMIIGRIFDSVRRDVEGLCRAHADRVLFTGRVPYDELPLYLAHSRVGIAPFVLSRRTRAINPNKLYMYAAMNMNVVSTPFSDETEHYGDVIRLARSPSEFASAVEEGLGDDDRRRVVRERVALPNSWDEKAKEFTGLLTRLTQG